ncbi:MAG: hypothetical protein ACMG6S_36940 [Byssovorax sp.]
MFFSEAELASRIKHPDVCEILDLGEQNGALFLAVAMEWIDGESLSGALVSSMSLEVFG